MIFWGSWDSREDRMEEREKLVGRRRDWDSMSSLLVEELSWASVDDAEKRELRLMVVAAVGCCCCCF